jgi:predicted transcriptional regulator
MKTIIKIISHLILFKYLKHLEIHISKSITPKVMIPVPRISF